MENDRYIRPPGLTDAEWEATQAECERLWEQFKKPSITLEELGVSLSAEEIASAFNELAQQHGSVQIKMIEAQP